MLRKNQVRASRRRGVILLVVLALLTLFAILGITFVYYSSAEQTGALIARQAETKPGADVDPELALSLFLGQLIYDLPDDTTGVYSALRGNSLARSAYGLNPPDPTSNSTNASDDKPFCGVGRLHHASPLGGVGFAADDAYWVNFTYFQSDGFLRDPERYYTGAGGNNGARPNLTTPKGPHTGGFHVPYTYPDHNNIFLAMMRPSDGTILVPSFHRPSLFDPLNQGYPNAANWTNQVGKYLTCVVRPQDMGAGFPTPDSKGLSVKNLEWAPGGNDSPWIDIGLPEMTAPDGTKFKMLVAPLIIELDSRLNLNVLGNVLGTGNTHASNQGWGLFEANLSKVLNSAANANEWQNLFLGNPPFSYTAPQRSRTYGRYGPNRLPQGTAMQAGTSSRIWAPGDLDGTQDPPPNALSSLFLFPTSPPVAGAVPYQIFPSFNANGVTSYGNGVPLETTDSKGNQIHPLMFNSQRPVFINASLYNRTLPVANMFQLLRFGSTTSGNYVTGGDALNSDLIRLCPQNLASDASDALCVKRRNLVTLKSADLDRLAGTPYIFDALNTANAVPQTRFQFNTIPLPANPSGWSQVTPTANNPIPYPAINPRATPPASNSDFSPPQAGISTLQSLLGAGVLSSNTLNIGGNPTQVVSQLLRVDLNRKLTQYPLPTSNPTNNPPQVFDPNNPLSPGAAILTQAQQAITDRQNLANDIFNALRTATGALPPATIRTTYGATSPEYYAARYLAQVAVNIVDYLDYDDYSTPFNFDPGNPNSANGGVPGANGGWVYGTELPRLVLNEVYASLDNNGTDAGPLANPITKALLPYNVNLWAELHNPFVTDTVPNSPFGSTDQTAVLHNGFYAPYVVAIMDPAANPLITNVHQNLRDPGNVTGDPLYNQVGAVTNPTSIVQDYVPTTNPPPPANAPNYRSLQPNNNAYSQPIPQPQPPNATTSPLAAPPSGFYVLGPDNTAFGGFVNNTGAAKYNANPGLPVTSAVPGMCYQVPVTTVSATNVQPTILLRRLACPGLPPNPPLNANGSVNTAAYNAALPPNPYITVDYIELNQILPNHPNQNEVFDGRIANVAGIVAPLPIAPNVGPNPAPNIARSYGRTQPFAGYAAQRVAQNPNPAPTPFAPYAYQPPNTFFRHNAVEGTAPPNPATPGQTLKVPFDWLVHLDRQAISPMELLHVSGFKPHELTQQFVDPNGVATPGPTGLVETASSFKHIAPWQDQTTRLYRFFEFVETRSRAAGVALGGRIPGKVNINMLWDTWDATGCNVFRALCDAQAANLFSESDSFTNVTGQQITQNDVQVVWNQFLLQRSPTGDGSGTPNQQMPGASDNPIWGFGVGPYPPNPPIPGITPDPMDPNAVINPATPTPRGILNSLLRPNAATPLIFDPFPPDAQLATPMHPYRRMQLLTKIQNHLTTRSNVFAVWLTVGFFTVTNDTTQPIQLGAEVGFAEGRHVRHRMFAIVDRSHLTAFSTTSTAQITVAAPQQGWAPQPVQAQVQLAQMSGTNSNTNRAFTVQAGSVLVYDPNTDNEETVVVTTNAQAQLVANFLNSHNSGCTVISRGNPGPWPRYNPRNDTNVVPFFAIID